jgi:mitotic spindle assembly checkpoint protein MAD2B
VREDLLLGTVSRIGIVIFSLPENSATGSAKILERYMFDVSTFPVVSKSERNLEMEWESSASEQENDSDGSDAPVVDTRKKGKEKEWDADVDVNLSEQFRAALMALTSRTSRLEPLPANCSFNISMELKDEADVDPPIKHPQPWIPVQPSLQKTGRKATVRDENEEEAREKAIDEGEDLGGVKVTPIRAIEAGVFRFETWIEEGKAKFEKQSDSTKTSFGSSIG